MTPEEMQKYLDSSVDRMFTDKKVRDWHPVRIFYNGRFLIMPSGHTIWKSIGHAKNALNYHLVEPLMYECSSIGKLPYLDRKKACDEFKKYLFSVVEFVGV